MKAVVVKSPGGVKQLKIGEVETPVPSAKEILVKVMATALNRADILQREGKYPPPKGASEILGLEIAGIVEAVGSDVQKWKKGDKVFGLLPGGSYAEYAVIHEDLALPLPDYFSFEEAAAIPEVFLTAYQALVWIGKLQQGEKVLIHAAASGVGTAAIQIAKEFGAKVYGTASAAKHKTCLNLGADQMIDYKADRFSDRISDITGDTGVDLIIDFIGGPNFKHNIEALNTDGRLVLLAAMGGGNVGDFSMAKILMKRLQITGSTLRSRDLNYQIDLTRDFWKFAEPRFKKGSLKPVIDQVFDWQDVGSAHALMEANQNEGKIVLKVG
jgi:tumor protein p53-inducible protein 3